MTTNQETVKIKTLNKRHTTKQKAFIIERYKKLLLIIKEKLKLLLLIKSILYNIKILMVNGNLNHLVTIQRVYEKPIVKLKEI